MRHLISYVFIFFIFECIASAQYAPGDILFSIGDRTVSAEEFEKAYNKNSSINSIEKQGLTDYFNLYLKFRLKVSAALDSRLDTFSSFKKEFKGYRDQLAGSYLTDIRCTDSLVREAYEHMQYDVNVSHIMVLFPENPQDTVAAYRKINDAWQQLRTGKPFEEVALQYSEDPSVSSNKGNLGYFTAFRFPYLFEKCAYNTKPGEISGPLRTAYGYHIIRVNEKRPSAGEVKVAHVMVMVPQNSTDSVWVSARHKIAELYQLVKNDENFSDIARQFSDDRNSAKDGGELPWFGTGQMVPEFEKAAFSLKEPEEISEPLKTAYGWHLIQLKEKRKIPEFGRIKNELKTKIMNDERAGIIKESFLKKLKNKYKTEVYTENLAFFNNTQDIPAEKFSNPVFTIEDKTYTCSDFKNYLASHPKPSPTTPAGNFIESSFRNFSETCLTDYEESHMEKNNPEFRDLVKEYYDGILLFDIMDKQIWSRSVTDSAGIDSFYRSMKKKPMWDKRLDATVFTCANMETAGKVRNEFIKNKDITISRLQNLVCGSDSVSGCLTMERRLFPKGENTFIDSVQWKKGFTGFTSAGNKILFAYIWKIRKPETKSLEEIRGLVTADYQNYLEEEWIKNLKNKYKVVIYSDLLHKIEEKYKHQL